MESIKVTSLDIADVTEADLAPKFNEYIREPGTYNLEVIDYKMGMKKQADGAGKNWGWLRLTLRDTESKAVTSGFLDVPVDSLVFTSKEGKTSHFKAAQFKQFLVSLGIQGVTINSLGKHINNLGNILDANPRFTAILGYNADHVAYRGKDADGNNQYGIELNGGGSLLDEDGSEVLKGSFDEIKEYYKEFKGYEPQTELQIRVFK